MKRLLFTAALLAVSLPAFAHHSTTAEFDVQHRMTVSGTLAKVDWVNPHIVVFIDVKGEKSRADFAKAIGQTVTVEGNRAKDGSLYGYLLKITYADGNSLELVPPASDR